MAFTPTTAELSDLKMFLGIAASDTSQDSKLNLVLRTTGQKILTDINQATLPTDLDPILVEMAADAWTLLTGAPMGVASTISDNGQSVSFISDAVFRIVAETVKNYEAQLGAYRKPRW